MGQIPDPSDQEIQTIINQQNLLDNFYVPGIDTVDPATEEPCRLWNAPNSEWTEDSVVFARQVADGDPNTRRLYWHDSIESSTASIDWSDPQYWIPDGENAYGTLAFDFDDWLGQTARAEMTIDIVGVRELEFADTAALAAPSFSGSTYTYVVWFWVPGENFLAVGVIRELAATVTLSEDDFPPGKFPNPSADVPVDTASFTPFAFVYTVEAAEAWAGLFPDPAPASSSCPSQPWRFFRNGTDGSKLGSFSFVDASGAAGVGSVSIVNGNTVMSISQDLFDLETANQLADELANGDTNDAVSDPGSLITTVTLDPETCLYVAVSNQIATAMGGSEPVQLGGTLRRGAGDDRLGPVASSDCSTNAKGATCRANLLLCRGQSLDLMDAAASTCRGEFANNVGLGIVATVGCAVAAGGVCGALCGVPCALVCARGAGKTCGAAALAAALVVLDQCFSTALSMHNARSKGCLIQFNTCCAGEGVDCGCFSY